MIDRMIYQLDIITPKGIKITRWVVSGDKEKAVSIARSKYPNAQEIRCSGKTSLLIG